MIIIILIASLSILSEDAYQLCPYKACKAAISDGGLFTDSATIRDYWCGKAGLTDNKTGIIVNFGPWGGNFAVSKQKFSVALILLTTFV